MDPYEINYSDCTRFKNKITNYLPHSRTINLTKIPKMHLVVLLILSWATYTSAQNSTDALSTCVIALAQCVENMNNTLALIYNNTTPVPQYANAYELGYYTYLGYLVSVLGLVAGVLSIGNDWISNHTYYLFNKKEFKTVLKLLGNRNKEMEIKIESDDLEENYEIIKAVLIKIIGDFPNGIDDEEAEKLVDELLASKNIYEKVRSVITLVQKSVPKDKSWGNDSEN